MAINIYQNGSRSVGAKANMSIVSNNKKMQNFFSEVNQIMAQPKQRHQRDNRLKAAALKSNAAGICLVRKINLG